MSAFFYNLHNWFKCKVCHKFKIVSRNQMNQRRVETRSPPLNKKIPDFFKKALTASRPLLILYFSKQFWDFDKKPKLIFKKKL